MRVNAEDVRHSLFIIVADGQQKIAIVVYVNMTSRESPRLVVSANRLGFGSRPPKVAMGDKRRVGPSLGFDS